MSLSLQVQKTTRYKFALEKYDRYLIAAGQSYLL
jgi:hypothetical protein